MSCKLDSFYKKFDEIIEEKSELNKIDYWCKRFFNQLARENNKIINNLDFKKELNDWRNLRRIVQNKLRLNNKK
jgi:hypothetical protein